MKQTCVAKFKTFTLSIHEDMGSSKKSCSKDRIMWNAWSQKEFLQWNTRTKDHLCKFSKYLVVIKIMNIRHKICHIYYRNADFKSIVFAKRFTILLLYVCQIFSNLQDHLHFFLHFVFSFMGQLFMDDPISTPCNLRIGI